MKKSFDMVGSPHCPQQLQRTIGFETYLPCNNCIFYTWSYQDSKYICKHPYLLIGFLCGL